MKEVLNSLFEHKALDKETAKRILVNLAQGKYNSSQVAAFLTVYLMRNITVEELEGFRDAMLELCVKVDLTSYDVIDLCGTGGDGKNTFNISTLSSFIVAGAGQNVAKHGNNGVSSVSGSSNLMAQFGYAFTNDISRLNREIEESGLCFLHAPLFHPAMKNIAPIRGELGVKTFFNMLGPMVNPAFPPKQLVGVFNLELARLYGYLYQKSDKDFVILHSLDGYDEISLTGPFKMVSRDREEIITPESLGFTRHKEEDLYGGETVEEAAKIFLKVIKGEGTKAQAEVVTANAAFALYCGKKYGTIEEAIEAAKDSLMSGRAYERFKALMAIGANA